MFGLEPTTPPSEGFLRLLLATLTALGLIACNTGSPETNTTTIDGSVGTGLETDIELFGQTGLSPQAQSEPTFAFSDTYVVAIAANGKVLGSGLIGPKGKFNLSVPRDNTVALALATKGQSGWVCQQALEYSGADGVRTAALKTQLSSINAGSFRFSALSGRPASGTTSAGEAATSLEAFEDTSLLGFLKCGNPRLEESTVSLDYDISANKIAGFDQGVDDPRLYQNTVVYGLDTTQATPRWIAAARVGRDGRVNLRVRHERDTDVTISPTLADTRDASAQHLLIPTWNANLPAVNVAGGMAIGKIVRNLIRLQGEVRNTEDQALEAIRVGARNRTDTVGFRTQGTDPVVIARNRASSAKDGSYEMLLPAPVNGNSDWALKAQGSGCNAEESASLASDDQSMLDTGQKRAPIIYLGACQAPTSSGVRVLEVTTTVTPSINSNLQSESSARYLSGGDPKAPVLVGTSNTIGRSSTPDGDVIAARFTIQNPSNGERFDNLTLYAASVNAGSGLGEAGLEGSAIQELSLIGSKTVLAAADALAVTPVHGQYFVSGQPDFQVITPLEVNRVQTIINQSGLVKGLNLLDYGFVARSPLGSPTYSRNIEPNNTSATVTIAWRIPKAWLSEEFAALRIKATFVLANQKEAYHSQDITAWPTDVYSECLEAGHGGISKVLVFGRLTPVTPPAGCSTVRVASPRIAKNVTLAPTTMQFGQGGADEALAVTSDSRGARISVGRTSGVIAGASQGGNDYWIAKFHADTDQVLWAKQGGTGNSDEFTAVTTDANDNIYAVGRNQNGGLVIKYDTAGNVLWQGNLANDNGYTAEQFKAIAVNDSAVYLGGTAYSSSTGFSHPVVYRLNPSTGTTVWRWVGQSPYAEINGLAITGNGALVAAGSSFALGHLIHFGSNPQTAPSNPAYTNIGSDTQTGDEVMPYALIHHPEQPDEVIVAGTVRDANVGVVSASSNINIGFVARFKVVSGALNLQTAYPVSMGGFKTTVTGVQHADGKYYAAGFSEVGTAKKGFLQRLDTGVPGWTRELGSSNDTVLGLAKRTRYGATDQLLVAGWTTGSLEPYVNQGQKDALLGGYTLNGY